MSVIHGALENRQLGNKGKSTAETGWAVAAHMEPNRQALLGRHFGTIGIHEFPGHSSFHPINFQNSHPLPGSSSPPPSPPSPQLLARGSAGKEGTAGRTRPSSGIRHIPTKRFGGGNQPVSVVLDMRQPCITTHLVSASHGPCQPLLYLRNC